MSTLGVSTKPRLLAIVIALFATGLLTGAQASASTSGGIGTGSGGTGTTTASGTAGSTAERVGTRYDRIWDQTSVRDKRWAHSTSECESGGDPDAIGGGGLYRGAFQFMRSTWKASPKSPGGDPIAYPYRTQAVVAVLLKNRDGADHWPVCG
jgi:hypothetical protein